MRALRRMVREYSENARARCSGCSAGRLQLQVAWGVATCRDLRRQPRRRHDLRLFRADLGGCSGASAGSAAAAGRGSSPPPSRTIMRPSPRPATPTAGCCKRGVEIFEYQPTKLHTKLVVIDDVVHIGSSNFDFRSLYLNLEMMLRVDDRRVRRRDARLFRAASSADCVRDHAAGAQASARPWSTASNGRSRFFLVTSVDYTRHPAAELRPGRD